MDIDMKKLLKQDIDFNNFAKGAMFAMLTANKDSDALLKSIYSFYNLGMSLEQVSAWLISMQNLNGTQQ